MKLFLLLTFIIFLSIPLFSQDEEPPTLHSIEIVPDSALNGDSISIVMVISDDITGVSGYGFPQLDSNYITYARVSDPDSNQARLIYGWINTSGNTYYSKIKIPDYTASGYWKVDFVYAVDTVGNPRYYYNNIDFNATCYITSNSIDTIPPVLNSLNVIPNSANNGDTVLVRIDATDDLSGISGGNTIARFSNPYGVQEYFVTNWTHDTNNIYFGEAIIDQYAEAGTWAIDYITLYDQAGNNETFYNWTDFDGTVHVTSPGLDLFSPVLDSINFMPPQIYDNDTMYIIMYARDNLSGISGEGFPNGDAGGLSYAEINNNIDEEFYYITSWTQVGTDVYEGKFFLPSYAHIGVWTVTEIYLTDQVGNDRTYYSHQYNSDFYVNDSFEGIDNVFLNNLISIYPNPVQEELYINSDLDIYSISLYSSSGQILKIYDGQNNLINLQEFDKGFYLLLISTSEGSLSKKIIKN